MKLVIIILIATGLQSTAMTSEAQSVTLTGKNLSLGTIFKEIRKQTQYQFFYKNEYLKTAKSVNINVKNVSVRKALDVSFKKQPLSYSIVGKTIVVERKNLVDELKTHVRQKADSLFTIKGRVFNTQEPPEGLPGVVVRVEGTDRGTVSDEDGYFTIKTQKGEVLKFSLVGFGTVEQTVLKKYKNLVISLKEKVSELQQLQVVGKTTMEKQHIASSLSTVNVESNIEGKPITSLSQALQGGTTGLTVNQGSGLPGGDAASIKIRGISTLGNSDPLVLVDGVPMPMNQINPNTVESVTILKDAAAAAIYGARAANGVILIKTKRGEAGRVSLNYDGYYGVQMPTRLPKPVDAPTYMQMYNIAQLNSGGTPLYSNMEIQNTIKGDDPIRYPNTNWVKEALTIPVPITDHSISVTGGNHLARFAITGEYMNQKGMTNITYKKRYNIRANTSITLANNFFFYLDVLTIKKYQRVPFRSTGNGGTRVLDDIYRVPPTILPKYPEEEGWPTMYGRYADIVNPIAYYEQGGTRDHDYSKTSINIQPHWEVIPGLNIKGQYTFRQGRRVNHDIRDNYYFFDYYSKQLVQTWGLKRSAAIWNNTNYSYLSATADYTLNYDAHHLFAMAGYSQQTLHNGEWDVSALQSVFGKVNYSYLDKYLLEASLRMDGSSKFGPDHKFGYFPSVAVGWNVSKEDFLRNSNIINNWKIRASYGELRNDNIGLYKYETLISATSGLVSVWGNPDISWEQVNMLDIGTDIDLFNNKLNVTFDYYDKLTDGIILSPPVSYVGALGSAPINIGKVSNKGWEFSLKYNNRINRDLSFFVRTGLSYNKNEIQKLVDGPYKSSDKIKKEGFPINTFYGYKTKGLLQVSDFEKDGVTPKIPVTTNGESPGDIRYVDVNGDGEITEEDKTVIGNPSVPPYNYFADIGITWKKLSLEILLQGVSGSTYSANNTGKSAGQFFNPLNVDQNGGVPTTYYAAHVWKRGGNNTNALFPRLNAHPTMNKLYSDFWLYNDAYLRVKFVQLSYDLSTPFFKNKGINSLSVYVNAQNPLVFSSIPIVDPESKGSSWTYGIMQMYTLGVHIGL